MIRLLPLRNFACKFRLRSISIQINSCHNRIMIYRALWDRRHEGATRISQCTRRVAPSALTYPSGPWSHNARYIMLESLSTHETAGQFSHLSKTTADMHIIHFQIYANNVAGIISKFHIFTKITKITDMECRRFGLSTFRPVDVSGCRLKSVCPPVTWKMFPFDDVIMTNSSSQGVTNSTKVFHDLW